MSTSNNEFTQAALLERVNTVAIAHGNPRVRTVVARIVTDLFKAVDELDVSPDEFWAATEWFSRLGASGQIGLITAGLGFDRLLDIRLDEADAKAGVAAGTPRAIEGPLYVAGAPLSKNEAVLDNDSDTRGTGKVLVMEGKVLDHAGKPVANATVDVWHTNKDGGYSHFFPGMKEFELRRKIETDADGSYRFRTTLPPGYAIPPNSPTSELFEALGRHGRRPAHIHFHIVKQGHRTLTTQVNIPGDTYIDDDFAFATRDGLVLEIEHDVAPSGYESLGVTGPFERARFDFVMQEARSASDTDPRTRIARVSE